MVASDEGQLRTALILQANKLHTAEQQKMRLRVSLHGMFLAQQVASSLPEADCLAVLPKMCKVCTNVYLMPCIAPT